MLLRETNAVYCGNHTKHKNTFFGENLDLWYVKACGTDNKHWALKG
jgi:hypothetical protein